jgi:phosphatidylglycerol---prolipoprotein diacylglyceryl transferase
MILAAIDWTVSPEIFTIGPLTLRWYGLLFALGFLVGQRILIHIFKKDGHREEDVDELTVYMVLSTIIGARLGHCLFYQPDYYLAHPVEILKVWEGGLASHGATVGILFALFLYANYRISLSPLKARKEKKKGQSYLWVLDRIVIVTALAGMMIRLGNLMNSEIYGEPTNLPWGFRFLNDPGNPTPDIPRHPTQIYEALFCLFLFILLFNIWRKRRLVMKEGFIFSLFLILLFGSRFLVEFIKEPQVDFESKMALNMGQILSIPLVIAGTILLIKTSGNREVKTQGTGS